VLNVVTNRGAERWGERFNSGTATIVVDNTDGRFTPDAGDAFWHQPFRPGRQIRVVAIPDEDSGIKVPLITGFVDSSIDEYGDGWDLQTSIGVLDFMAEWSENNPLMLATPTGVQTTSARVSAALDRLSWPAGLRDIQTGLHTMQTSHLAQSTLEECARAADAEGGAFFCGEDGSAVFRARDWLTTDARSIATQGYLGYDGTPGPTAFDLAYVPSWERSRIVNEANFARIGGLMQNAFDPTSQSLYKIRTRERTDLHNNSDAEVLFLAARTVEAFKDSRARIDAVTFSALDDPDNEDLNRMMWDTKIGDRLSILVAPGTGWSFEKEVHVMGISHEITADDWLVTLRLDDAFTF
jgi:hypothetical protein